MSDPEIRTMEEFAAASGLSRPTVSKYFNDPDSVRPATRKRIEAALERHDYHPNIFAMNQNRKLTKSIGVVVPYLADPFFGEIARKIEQQCIDAGYRPTLFSSHGDPAMEVEILDTLRSLKPAGVLLAPLGRASNRSAVEAFASKVPTVLFDSMIADVGVAFVGSDNPQFGKVIVNYLCRSGEPPCFLEMENPSNPNANKRRVSYINAMEALGHEPVIVKVRGEGWSFEEIGRDGGAAALAANRFTTNTVLCSNDRLAIGLLAACYEQGVRVGLGPDAAMRVAGQDDHPFSRFTCPSLTTIAQDYDAISQRAVAELFNAISKDAREASPSVALFSGRLIMRNSA